METWTGSELPGAAGDGQLSDTISPDSQMPLTPPSGKLKKTALKFFGGRKSICMLPSFFVGRGKSQGRWSSKMGITKSQTYDGVSRACWEDRNRGGGDVTSAEFEFHNPNSSVEMQKAQERFAKSQSLPRQKKGLRGFFSSIRKHRKSKNFADVEKNGMLEMSSSEKVPGKLTNIGCHGDSNDSKSHVDLFEPDVPAESNSSEIIKMSTADTDTIEETRVPENLGNIREEKEEEKTEFEGQNKTEKKKERKKQTGLVTYRQPLSADSELARLSKLHSDLPEGDPATLSTSTDNLVFEDVSSLKSFDSFTGCGDIIADQDDVSVAESSVSGERGSRNAGKRSSCLVTYQGGGEEMATPDDVDNEYLHSLWESEGSEVCYLPSEQTSSPDQPTSSFHVTTSTSGNTSTSPLGITETVLTPTDILTPQSDRQGSVPNSDEGYYDSTTPGADEDTRERPQQRLPRDSYSGDALYELFEPDDRLLSPPLPSKDNRGMFGGNKSKGDFISAFTSAALESGAMETEEERLSKIQHALLCCELQNLRNPAKDQHFYCNDHLYSDTHLCEGEFTSLEEDVHHSSECRPLPGSQISKTVLSHSRGQVEHRTLSGPTKSKKQATKAASTVKDGVLYSRQEKYDTLNDRSLPLTRSCSQSQEELMVCFSQALVDFTKTRHYRNSTESLDGSESSSPFGPNLSALPAIVTFDVVDMENEGECEQPELVEEEEEEVEEELTSPFETFDDDSCYLQQDAFAECDQRTFDTYEQSLLLSNAWGIASLPRHLSLRRPCPPVPAPLALNRRSRSLDTDSLELQTSELYVSLFSHGQKMATSFHRRKKCADKQEPCEVSQQERDCRPAQGCEFGSSQKDTLMSPHQPRSLRGSPWLDTLSSCSRSSCQPAVRPSHLPLQAAYHNSSAARILNVGAEGHVSCVGRSNQYPSNHLPAGQWKHRPVGITQGIPHHGSDQSESTGQITTMNRQTEMEAGYSTATPSRKM